MTAIIAFTAFTKTKGPHGWLSNMSHHPLVWHDDGRTWLWAEVRALVRTDEWQAGDGR